VYDISNPKAWTWFTITRAIYKIFVRYNWGHETEIENLRCKNKELREKLRNALQLISLKEEGEQELERQLIEANTINIQLKNRIKELISKTCKSGQDMAQVLNPIDAILGCRQTISTSLQGIQIYIDGNQEHDDNATPV